ncbi:MAG: glycine--tRNA ligase subunit beta [Acidobacteriota bacterium]|nr:MAG: glycine--tRNA ligase subunit beta [Acidobacteriota bacterium]
MSNKFLFELGTEEIPADMIKPALGQLKEGFESLMTEHQVEWSELETFSTPRRLAVLVAGLPDRCPDREEVLTGPPKSIAFDDEGHLTPAGRGFARKFGLELEQLETVHNERGEYLAARRKIVGDAVPEILGRALPGLIASISWPKNMYWRESRFRFIRPLRWFLSLWNSDVVEFELEGVAAGRVTRGHRFLGGSEIAVDHVDAYRELMRKNFVIVDSAERLDRIERGLSEGVAGYSVNPDAKLLEIVVQLNEFPSALTGEFDPAFLDIPEEVLITVMRFHQKYFSLADEKGRLAPYFLTIVNTDGDPEGTIRKGHEKVLQARLEDAAFFWETDRKSRLEERVSALDHVLFQEKLGSYGQKTERIGKICAALKPGQELAQAARLCKTDLTTDMVREFPELQGVMGGLYARSEGLEESVWKAIYEHYLPVSMEDQLPSSENGVLLSIADRLDTVVGCFGIGLIPTGSSDPLALRRQAQGLVALLFGKDLELDLNWLVSVAQENFVTEKPAEETRAQVLDFLRQRVQFILQKEGIPSDVLRAVFAAGLSTVPDAYRRALALSRLKGDPNLEALAVAFKRTRNILEKHAREIPSLRPELFVDKEEKLLYEAFLDLKPKVERSLEERKPLAALTAMAAVRETVDLFFDRVLVMAEDVEVRHNRFALLRSLADVFMSIADISEIVQQGGQNGS